MSIFKKILKWLLIGLGSITSLLIIIIYLANDKQNEFIEQNQKLSDEFVTQLSKTKSVKGVSSYLSLDLIRNPNFNEANIGEIESLIKEAGDFQKIEEVITNPVKFHTSGNTTSIDYNVKFSKTNAHIKVDLIENDNKVKVIGFYFTPLQKIEPPANQI